MDNENGSAGELTYPLSSALLPLAGHFGKTVTQSFLFETLRSSSAEDELTIAEDILHKLGLITQISSNTKVSKISNPIIIGCRDGNFLTVLRVDGDDCIVSDAVTKGGVNKITTDDLNDLSSGVVLSAAESIDDLQARVAVPPRDGHWFWRELSSQGSLLRDAIIGSLFGTQ